jgi:hypothetical protein
LLTAQKTHKIPANREVALKLLLHGTADEVAPGHLLREAQTAFSLSLMIERFSDHGECPKAILPRSAGPSGFGHTDSKGFWLFGFLRESCASFQRL